MKIACLKASQNDFFAKGEANDCRGNPAGTRNCNVKRGAAGGSLRPYPLYLVTGFSGTFFFRAYRSVLLAQRIYSFYYLQSDPPGNVLRIRSSLS